LKATRPGSDERPKPTGWRILWAVHLVSLGLLVAYLLPLSPKVEAHGSGLCARIWVESRDRGILLSSYIVGEPEYVARMHAQIDRYGQDGIWTTAAGDLGSIGYTVTYSCVF
jgi:hypothetical protein